MEFDTCDDGCSQPYLTMALMFQNWITVTANNSYWHHSDIYISLSFLFFLFCLSFLRPHLFLFIYFLLYWTLTKNRFWWSLFEIKDEILFLNPLSLLRFIHFSIDFFHFLWDLPNLPFLNYDTVYFLIHRRSIRCNVNAAGVIAISTKDRNYQSRYTHYTLIRLRKWWIHLFSASYE